MYQKIIVICWVLFVGLILLSVESIAGQEVFQKGVASTSSDSKSVNVAELRQRAVKNAMDLAVLQVTGAQISSEKSGAMRTQETTVIRDGHQANTTTEQSRFNTAIKTRTEGHARLVKIIREWLDGRLYYVEAVFDVDTPEELLATKNAGYYWNKAGRPSLGLSFKKTVNGQEEDTENCKSVQFLRENISKNNLAINSSPQVNHYLIKINQQITTQYLPEMGTTTVNCSLSFQLVDQVKGKTIAEFRKSNGPQAGFSTEQATDDCLKKIAPAVAEKLIRTIAKTMNDHWSNGAEYVITIDHVSGSYISGITEILNNIFQVTNTLPPKYNYGTYTQEIKYKGNAGELSQAILEAFNDEGWSADVRHIDEQTIQLNWTTSK